MIGYILTPIFIGAFFKGIYDMFKDAPQTELENKMMQDQMAKHSYHEEP